MSSLFHQTHLLQRILRKHNQIWIRRGIYHFLQPLTGTLSGYLVLGETLSPGAFVGAGLIGLGVMCVFAGRGRPATRA